MFIQLCLVNDLDSHLFYKEKKGGGRKGGREGGRDGWRMDGGREPNKEERSILKNSHISILEFLKLTFFS